MRAETPFSRAIQQVLAPRIAEFGFGLSAVNWNTRHEEAFLVSRSQLIVVSFEYYEDYLDARVGPASAMYLSKDDSEHFYRDFEVINLRKAASQLGCELPDQDFSTLDLRSDDGLARGIEMLADAICIYAEALKRI